MKKLQNNRKQFYAFIRYLHKNLPTDYKTIVKVSKKELEDYGGFVIDSEKQTAIITIDGTESEVVMIETLIHEWAHILDGPDWREEHRDSWGVQYSRVYRAYRKYDERRKK